MKYFILRPLWCFYFTVKIEWKCHFPTQSFIWQLYRAVCKIFTFPSWHFEKNWLRVCFSWTSRSDHVQSWFALFPQLWLKFPFQCPWEPGKIFSVHHFHFPPPCSSSWWVWMVPGRGQSFCMLWPILLVSRRLSHLFHNSVIPDLLACPDIKGMMYLRAKRKSLLSQSTRGICRCLHPTAVHGTTQFMIFFFPSGRLLEFGCVSVGFQSPLRAWL